MKHLFLSIFFILSSNALEASQKDNPFQVSHIRADNFLHAKIKADQEVSALSLINVRGIDGVTVHTFGPITKLNLKANETTETQIEISHFLGRALVVMDISYRLKGIIQRNSLVLPIGSLSTAQIKERRKNLKAIKVQNKDKSITTENVHYMQIK
jgi:hypothetical protein